MAAIKLLFLLICIITIGSISTVHSTVDLTTTLGWLHTRSAPSCDGSIADCLAGDELFEMDNEINRRILATTQYISYGALQRNRVPCSRRGASYYNCKPGAQANPYTRGCSAITRCRR